MTETLFYINCDNCSLFANYLKTVRFDSVRYGSIWFVFDSGVKNQYLHVPNFGVCPCNVSHYTACDDVHGTDSTMPLCFPVALTVRLLMLRVLS